MWISQTCFSLGFLSQNSLWKLSTFRGYKGYLYWSKNGMRRVRFFKTGLAGGLASRLGWVASSSRKLTEWPGWVFCLVVLQLVRLFIFLHTSLVCCSWRLASREWPASLCIFAQSWAFLYTFSLTTLTSTRWLIKFNLTILLYIWLFFFSCYA